MFRKPETVDWDRGELLEPVVWKKDYFENQGWSYVNAVCDNFSQSGFYLKLQLAKKITEYRFTSWYYTNRTSMTQNQTLRNLSLSFD